MATWFKYSSLNRYPLGIEDGIIISTLELFISFNFIASFRWKEQKNAKWN